MTDTAITNLRFGVFYAPFHALNENPTLMFDRDLELIMLLDRLGYDEAWIGEHHSGGFETIAAPEIFIAGASRFGNYGANAPVAIRTSCPSRCSSPGS